MKQIELQIISNIEQGTLRYQIKNESGEWVDVSRDSNLSRYTYTKVSIKEDSDKILSYINQTYNRNNRGLVISFIGTDEEYRVLCKNIEKYEEIQCKRCKNKLIVIGGKSVGKSTLIESAELFNNKKFVTKKEKDYDIFIDDCNEWYEIAGLSYDENRKSDIVQVLAELVDSDVKALLYCIDAEKGKLEDIESQFIKSLQEKYPEIEMAVVLTNCIGTDYLEFVNMIMVEINHVRIIQVVAKDKKIDIGKDTYLIEQHGMDELIHFVFEGR